MIGTGFFAVNLFSIMDSNLKNGSTGLVELQNRFSPARNSLVVFS
jgi:hypothetical protein